MPLRTHRLLLLALALALACTATARAEVDKDLIFVSPPLKPVDSVLKVKEGDMAPDFTLPALDGSLVTLSSFRGKKNVVLSFVPAAWTPVCSDQWPGYILARELFEQQDAVLLGISTSSLPSLFAWTRQMGDVWFPVLSDFWPHGKASEAFGILRPEGFSERAIFVIDKRGVLRYIDVHDINRRPDLGRIIRALRELD